MKKHEINIPGQLGFHESRGNSPLRGRVSIYVQDTKTKEVSLWEESDNIIPISGYQYILLKLFGLHLDSIHNINFENPGRDTNIVIPDLNYDGKPTLGIGVDPKKYTSMEMDNSDTHFIQGFMVGNGGSGEDNISTKNTDYSFVNLRNPIPFRQTQTRLSPDIANEYLGKLRMGQGSFTKSFFIKRFRKRPSIVHSWRKDGQKWDYKDPVQVGDLGPNSINPHRNNRIETYSDVHFTIDEEDCVSYFNHEGATQSALLNELGLVAFDVVPGDRSILLRTYETFIRTLIELIMDNNRILRCPDCNAIVGEPPTTEQLLVLSKYVRLLAMQIKTVFDNISQFPGTNKNLSEFVHLINEIVESGTSSTETIITSEHISSRGSGYQVGEIVTTVLDHQTIYFRISKVNTQGEVLELICQNPIALLGFVPIQHDLFSLSYETNDSSTKGVNLKIKMITQDRTMAISTPLDWEALQKRLSSNTNINVEAFYNNNGTFVYFQDKFSEFLADQTFATLSTDEAQRIKLVTYYTFKAIPLESNRRILINYRIYSN